MIKKLRKSLLILAASSVVALVFAQNSPATTDSTSKFVNKKPGEITSTNPSKSSNWSKIKDLFL